MAQKKERLEFDSDELVEIRKAALENAVRTFQGVGGSWRTDDILARAHRFENFLLDAGAEMVEVEDEEEETPAPEKRDAAGRT